MLAAWYSFLTTLLPLAGSVAILALLAWLFVSAKQRWPAVRALTRLLFLTRFSLLFGLLLPGLVPLAWWIAPGLLGNLFVLDGPVQLVAVTFLSLVVAAMVLVTFRVTQFNAPVRFIDYEHFLKASPWMQPSPFPLPPDEPRKHDWCGRWLWLALMGLPVPLACWWDTVTDLSHTGSLWGWGGFAPDAVLLAWNAVLGVVGLLLGAGLAVLLLAALVALQEWLIHPDRRSPDLLPFESHRWLNWVRKHQVSVLYGPGDLLGRLLSYLGPGYSQVKDGVGWLERGQANVFVCLAVTLVVYFGCYAVVLLLVLFGSPPGVPEHGYWLPPLFSVLVLLLLLGFLFAGAAFFLDYYRVPVLLTVVALALLGQLLKSYDHYYDLNPPAARPAATRPAPPGFLDVFHEFGEDRFPAGVLTEDDTERDITRGRTLVVVTASGGGIQASAWTGRVLTGLHERYGKDFTRSVGLVSCVSGGSVGTLYYLSGWDPDAEDPLTPQALTDVRRRCEASSLEATAWGVVQPDFLRAFFAPLVPDTLDRGSAIEDAWRWRMGRDPAAPLDDTRLRDWIGPIREGKMPIVVFNATLAETGQRLLIAPVLGGPHLPRGGAGAADGTGPADFLRLYPESDVRASTAARLSATFPYVSPMCRPLPAPALPDGRAYHVCDGGYVDNEGGFTVFDWLMQLLEHYTDPDHPHAPPFDRVLLVRIQPFPPQRLEKAREDQGWLYASGGPLLALGNVRVASQAERNDLGVEFLDRFVKYETAGKWLTLMEDAQRTQGGLASPDPTLAQKEQDASAAKLVLKHVRFAAVRFVFQPQQKEYLVPLSWKLSRQQKAEVEHAWQTILADPSADAPLAQMDRLFAVPSGAAGGTSP